jgi:hypothetical protein
MTTNLTLYSYTTSVIFRLVIASEEEKQVQEETQKCRCRGNCAVESIHDEYGS